MAEGMSSYDKFLWWLRQNQALSEDFIDQVNSKVSSLLFEAYERGIKQGRKEAKGE